MDSNLKSIAEIMGIPEANIIDIRPFAPRPVRPEHRVPADLDAELLSPDWTRALEAQLEADHTEDIAAAAAALGGGRIQTRDDSGRLLWWATLDEYGHTGIVVAIGIPPQGKEHSTWQQEIDCRCVTMVRTDDSVMEAGGWIVADDEGLLVGEPRLNILASRMTGGTIAGRAVYLPKHTHDAIEARYDE